MDAPSPYDELAEAYGKAEKELTELRAEAKELRMWLIADILMSGGRIRLTTEKLGLASARRIEKVELRDGSVMLRSPYKDGSIFGKATQSNVLVTSLSADEQKSDSPASTESGPEGQ